LLGLEGQAAVEVGKLLGVGLMLMMNFIMITSAASTLDSAFISGSKLVVKDVGNSRKVTVKRGRIVMAIFALIGTLPVFMDVSILSATTVSGTMVLGLAPVFLFWNQRTSPVAFMFAVGAGLIVGIVLATGNWPEALLFTEGKYADLLSANVFGTLLSFIGFGIGSIIGTPKEPPIK